jgi:hypothetical protein
VATSGVSINLSLMGTTVLVRLDQVVIIRRMVLRFARRSDAGGERN